MKTAHNTTLRVSQLTYLRIMDAVVIEAAELSPAEGIALISAVNGYLHSADPIPTEGIDPKRIPTEGIEPERLSRYIELIDSAARRSERARRAALSRRKPTSHSTQTPQETPTHAPAETPTNTPKETPTHTPQETTQAHQESTQMPQETPTQPIQNPESQIKNSPIPTQPIPNSKSQIQNSLTPRHRIKIKHRPMRPNKKSTPGHQHR